MPHFKKLNEQVADADKDYKVKQSRATLEDSSHYQHELECFLLSKIKSNDPVFISEKRLYKKLIDNSLLSQGNFRIVFYEEGTQRIPLGNLHTFLIQLGRLKGHTLNIRRFSFEKQVPLSLLWKIAYDELPFVFPSVVQESFHSSTEFKKFGSEAYEFGSNEPK